MPAWLIGTLIPSSLFALRLPGATATAAKCCLAPTPYALKLALVDGEIRRSGIDAGKQLFELLKGREVRIEPPRRLSVTNALLKIAVPYESKALAAERAAAVAEAKGEDRYPFGRSMAFREVVHYAGQLRVAWATEGLGLHDEQRLQGAWSRVGWIGKRGSFVTAIPNWTQMSELPLTFGFPMARPPDPWPADVVVQAHDDLGPAAEFDYVSTFSERKVRKGIDRVSVLIAFPLRVERRGRGFTSYVRTIDP